MNKLLISLLLSAGLLGTAKAQTAPTFSGIALTPTTGLAFPLTYLTQESQPITATVKNTYLGSAATISAVASSDPQYVVTAETCTAAPLAKAGGTCTVTVKYVPSAVATASAAKINLTRTTAGGNFWIPVMGIADTVPKVPTLPAATTFSGISQTPAQGLAFAELLPGQTSAEQTLTLKNTYLGSAITLSAVTSSDPQFEITSQTCTAAPLAKNGGTCEVKVRFKPAAAGNFTGKLNFTRTSAGGNFYANLAGVGKGAVVAGYSGAQLTPTSLAFPDTAKGSTSAEQTITVKNTYAGTTWKVNSVTANISSYKVTGNDCGTLAPGATCTIKVAFAPTLVQALNGTITINRTVGTTTSNMIVKATGNGIAGATTPVTTAVVAMSPSPVTFDSTTLGNNQAKTVTITNTSGGALTVTPSVSGGDFSVVSNTCTGVSLAVNATCTVSVKFAPSASGARTGTLTATPNTGTAVTATLSGSGIESTAAHLRAEPGVLVMPATVVGQSSAPLTVTLTNTGTTSLAISSVTSSAPGEFSLNSTCAAPLAAGTACTATVVFQPASVGGRTGTLTIVHNGPSSPSQVQVGGNGLAASDLYVEPGSLTFGTVSTGTQSASQTVTLYNAGTSSLAIKTLALAGDNSTEFSQTNTCGTSIAAGATCTATVKFAPASSGDKRAALTVTDSVKNTLVQSIGLSGTGAQAQGVPSLTPTSLTFPATTVGVASAAQTLTLKNTGTAAMTVSSISTGTTEFTKTSSCTSVAAGASCTISVSFAPASSGTKADTLTVTTSGGAVTAALSGAAQAAVGNVTPDQTSIAFGSVAYNTDSAVKVLTLSNTGNASVTLGTLALPSNVTATKTCGTSLAAKATCTISLTYHPTAVGALSGNLTLAHGAGTLTVPVTGTGTGTPVLTVDKTSLVFATTAVGATSTAQTIQVTNTGNAPLVLASATADDLTIWPVTHFCGSIAPGASCSVSVTFKPTTTDEAAGTLNLASNGGAAAVSLGGNYPVTTLQGVCEDSTGGQRIQAPNKDNIDYFGAATALSKDNSVLAVLAKDKYSASYLVYIYKKDSTGKYVFNHVATKDGSPFQVGVWSSVRDAYSVTRGAKVDMYFDSANNLHLFQEYQTWVAALLTPSLTGVYTYYTYNNMLGSNVTVTNYGYGTQGIYYSLHQIEGPQRMVSAFGPLTWTNPSATINASPYVFNGSYNRMTRVLVESKTSNPLETTPLGMFTEAVARTTASKEFVLTASAYNQTTYANCYPECALTLREYSYDSARGAYVSAFSANLPAYVGPNTMSEMAPPLDMYIRPNNREAVVIAKKLGANETHALTYRRSYDSITGRWNWDLVSTTNLGAANAVVNVSRDGNYLYKREQATVGGITEGSLVAYKHKADGSWVQYNRIKPTVSSIDFGAAGVTHPTAVSPFMVVNAPQFKETALAVGTGAVFICR